MALVTTVGGSTSDSYVTVAEADTYHAAYGNASWAPLSNSAKESALRVACRYVDSYSFSGAKATAEQALQWPRIGASQDGFTIDSDVIPRNVKDAQCEAALRQSVAPLAPDAAGGTVTEETVGPITKKYGDGGKTAQKTYPIIDALLRPLEDVAGPMMHKVYRT